MRPQHIIATCALTILFATKINGIINYLSYKPELAQAEGVSHSNDDEKSGLEDQSLVTLIDEYTTTAELQDIQFPANAFSADGKGQPGIIDITQPPYNAAGDGVTDDTESINRAIQDHLGSRQIIYFPTGTYLVSDTLNWVNPRGEVSAGLNFHGQGQGITVIRLKDGAPGFQDPSQPKSVIRTNGVKGTGNTAHNNSLYFLTIDVGSNNPGAVGINYLVANKGTIRNVTIRSSDSEKRGSTGIAMLHEPGPVLLTNVIIEGFNYGIDTRGGGNSITVENLILLDQNVMGVRSKNQVINIRNLNSRNTVPAIVQVDQWGLITLVDSWLGGGTDIETAIRNDAGSALFIRNLRSTGYGKVIDNHTDATTSDVDANSSMVEIDEWVSHEIKSLFDGPKHSLNLPIKESPNYHTNDFSQWVSVIDFGATPNDASDDDSSAVQAAIDSGAEIVYFPRGRYHVTRPITIRGNVRRLMGFESVYKRRNDFIGDFMVEIGSLAGDSIIIEQFNGGISVKNDSTSTLVLRDLFVSGGNRRKNVGYTNTERGIGDLFIENVVGEKWVFRHGQSVWARHLNPEFVKDSGDGAVGIVNDSSYFWSLGIKSEGNFSMIKTVNGGQTEVLGYLIYPVARISPTERPLFINHESSMSLVYAELAYVCDRKFTTHIEETQNGVTRLMLKDDLQRRGCARVVPLYVAH